MYNTSIKLLYNNIYMYKKSHSSKMVEYHKWIEIFDTVRAYPYKK